jgi:hypothetical protein
MNRRTRNIMAAAGLLLVGLAPVAFGQALPGVAATFEGTISSAAQEDHFAFEVTTDQFDLNAEGGVDLVFLMTSVSGAGSPVDPGLISVAPTTGGTVKKSTRRPDTAGSTASIALATLTPGQYQITVRGEHKSTGAYRLEVLLAGDANTDYSVDAADLDRISELSGTKSGEAGYSPFADVDRNGVINGGDRERARGNLGAKAAPPQADNPLEVHLPAGALSLVGVSPDTFAPQSGGLRFSLVGAELDPTIEDVVLTINGARVTADRLVIEPHLLTANVTLANGRNLVAFKAYDTVGRALYYNATLWAGSSTLRVNLVNADGTPFAKSANVVASLSDDPAVAAQGTTASGSITFANLPGRTILVKAQGIDNEIGTAGVIGTRGVVTIKMTGFNPPSPVDNNDISLGTAGWVIGPGAPVSVVTHKEVIPGFLAGSSPALQAVDSIVDQDLMLGTSGEGERNLSRSFTTSAGTTAVKIRFRFITSEVPGGYFGTEFNDYFRVSLRSQTAGGSESETNSMNGLGLAAFNFATGETNWREVTLAVDRAGDTIQADIAVANVGDAFLQSQVVVDFVKEIKDQVRPALAWNNTAGGLDLTWEVLEQALEEDVTIEVHFASGTAYGNRLGDPIFSHVVPAGTAPGPGGPVRIPGGGLADDPAGTTHLLAASSETMIGALADVRIAYGANANAAVVSAGMQDVVKDGLRAAGASVGTITSTSRTPADQARAMFNNAVNTGAAAQFALYAAAGDAVIQVFVDQTTGLTPAQIRQNAGPIRAAMEAEIVRQGPERVSLHCADPAVRSVVDVAYNSFNATNRGLFQGAVGPRLTRILDEPNNNCFHLELVN